VNPRLFFFPVFLDQSWFFFDSVFLYLEAIVNAAPSLSSSDLQSLANFRQPSGHPTRFPFSG